MAYKCAIPAEKCEWGGSIISILFVSLRVELGRVLALM